MKKEVAAGSGKEPRTGFIRRGINLSSIPILCLSQIIVPPIFLAYIDKEMHHLNPPKYETS